MKQPISITLNAALKIKSMIEARSLSRSTLGIKLKMSRKGCGGNQYQMEYVESKSENDELFEIESDYGKLNIFVDKLCLFKVIGTTIDYKETDFERGFDLKHEKERGRCGCKKSFYY